MVEAWSDEDIIEAIEWAETEAGAIKKVKKIADLLGERREEVVAEVW